MQDLNPGIMVRFSQKRFFRIAQIIARTHLPWGEVKIMINLRGGDITLNSQKAINFAIAVPDVSLLPVAKD